MYNTSAIYKTEIKKNSRSFECRVTIGKNIYLNEDIVDIILETPQPTDGFSIGSTTSQTLDLTLINKGEVIYSTNQIKVEIGLKVGATIEYILMGLYNIDDIVKTDYTTKFTAFDNMIKFETPYFSNLGTTATLTQVVNELVTMTGVQFTGSLPAYNIKKLEGFTCREILSYIASICGGNAFITRDGKFTIVYPKDVGVAITGDNYIDYKREEVNYKIGKVSCQVGEKIIEKGSLGTDSMDLQFENPWVTESILTDIYNKVKTIEYLGYTMKWQGDLSIDVGDIITCTDIKGVVRKLPILSQKITYTGGLTSEIGAKGETKNKNSFSSSGSNANKVNRIVTDLLIVNEALINKANITDLEAVNIRTQTLEAKTATIETAIIDVAYITDLNVLNGSINNLIAEDARINTALINKANIVDLNAVKGNITSLTSDIANINTLLAGNITGGNIQAGGITSDKLTIQNGFITNLMVANIDVSKINAGDISTNKFRIVSADGGIEIVGATQQFKDKNNKVRIQMGKDTQGNFNFILRGEDGTTALIDHTGIKKGAIANDLIVKDMIATDAIGEKQIDYNSFATGFNKDTNTTTLKATHIKLDNQNQTLDVAFNQLKTQSDGTKSLTENNSTTIAIQQGQISTAISNSQIIKDGQTILLKDDYNRTVQTVNSTSETIGRHESTINANTGAITGVQTQVTEVKKGLDGITQRVSSSESNITTVTTELGKVDGKLTTAVSSVNSDNLVVDGGFENGGYMWTGLGVIENGTGVDGGKCLKLSGGSTIRGHYLNFSIPVIPGQRYRLGVWYKTSTDNNGTSDNQKVRLGLENGTLLHALSLPEVSINWKYKELIFRAPDNIYNIKASLTTDSKVGYILFDNVTLLNVEAEMVANQGIADALAASNKAGQSLIDAKLYTNAEITTVTTKVNTANSEITQLKNKIELKVEATDITTAISNISVGGRNLLKNSNFKEKGVWSGTVNIDTSNKYNDTNSIRFDIAGTAYSNSIKAIKGDIFAISVKSFIESSVIILPLVIFEEYTNDTLNRVDFQETSVSSKPDSWQLYIKYWTVKNTLTNNVRVRLYHRTSTGKVWFSQPQLETGNKATDYTIAPEDIDQAIGDVVTITESSISQAKADIKVETDKITQSVGNVETSIINVNGTANKAISDALKAQTAANTAQSTANTASTNASTANTKLSDIASDSKLTESEKKIAKKEWDIIVSEKAKIEAEGTKFGVSITDYTSKYNTLNTYITPLLANLNITSDIVGATFRTNFTNYYNARQDLLNSITTKAKTLADKGVADALKAQTSADSTGTEIIKTNTKLATVETSLSSITSRVTATENTTTSINGKLVAQETRLTTAEQKITDGSIINTVKASQTSGKATFAQTTTVEQLVDKVKFDFSSSGGYNLLKNGAGKNGTTYWEKHSGGTITGAPGTVVLNIRNDIYTGNENAIQVQVPGTMTSGEHGFKQTISTIVGRQYVFTCLLAGRRSTKTVVIRGTTTSQGSWLASKSFGDTYQGGENDWGKVVIPFIAQLDTTIIELDINSTVGSNGLLWAKNLMVCEGELWKPFSPNPTEIYEGNTVIDATGVTIKNGAITIQNNAGKDVLKGDTTGNLFLEGSLITRGQGSSQRGIMLSGSSVFIHDWLEVGHINPIGILSSGRLTASGRSVPETLLANEKYSALSLSYKGTDGLYYPYVRFDNDKMANTQQPIEFIRTTRFLDRVNSDLSFTAPTVYTNTVASTSAYDNSLFRHPQGGGWVANKNFYVNGQLIVSGSKTRSVSTKFGTTSQNAYETAECLFGDIGEGTIGEDGLCYVFIDPVMLETINTKCAYQVFLQVYGEGNAYPIERNAYPIERNEDHFVVNGTPGLKFGWELKAKQKGYENARLEMVDKKEDTTESENIFEEYEKDIDYEEMSKNYLQKYEEEIEYEY